MIDPIDLPDLASRYGIAPPAYQSGCYYQTTPSNSVSASATLGNGTLRVSPFIVAKETTFTRLGAEVTAAGDVGSTVRLGIYEDNGSGYPGALALDAGTIPGDAIAVAEVTISKKLKPGLYWCGAVVQGVVTTQPTVRTINGVPATGLLPITTGTIPAAGALGTYAWAAFSVTGALPSTFPTSKNATGTAVRVFAKVA